MISLSCYILTDIFFVSNELTTLILAIPVYSIVHGCGLMLDADNDALSITHTYLMANILSTYFTAIEKALPAQVIFLARALFVILPATFLLSSAFSFKYYFVFFLTFFHLPYGICLLLLAPV